MSPSYACPIIFNFVFNSVMNVLVDLSFGSPGHARDFYLWKQKGFCNPRVAKKNSWEMHKLLLCDFSVSEQCDSGRNDWAVVCKGLHSAQRGLACTAVYWLAPQIPGPSSAAHLSKLHPQHMFVKTSARDLLPNSSHLVKSRRSWLQESDSLVIGGNKMIVSTTELLSNFPQYFA